jgi:hypothetical protein
MQHDIVWADQAHIKQAITSLKRPGLEERLRCRWKYGWTIWPNCALPDAEGRITKEGGYCAMGTRLGISAAIPGARKDGKYVIAKAFKQIEPGYIAGEIDPSVWDSPEVKKQADRDAELIEGHVSILSKDAEDRRERNRRKSEAAVLLAKQWILAAAAIMGVSDPLALDETLLSTLAIMAKHSKKQIPPLEEYLKEFAEELKPEDEPEFLPSDDIDEFLGFSMRAYSSCVSTRNKVTKI